MLLSELIINVNVKHSLNFLKKNQWSKCFKLDEWSEIHSSSGTFWAVEAGIWRPSHSSVVVLPYLKTSIFIDPESLRGTFWSYAWQNSFTYGYSHIWNYFSIRSICILRFYVSMEKKKTMHLPVKICGVINSVTQPLPDFYMSHRTIKVFSLISGLETGTWFEG